MEHLPLLSHRTAAAVVAYRGGRAVTAGEFLADANHLAACLPAGRHVLNACVDRYRFTVGLAACLISGRVSLLPSTHTAEVVRQLAQFAPDAFCLTDAGDCDIELPLVRFPDDSANPVQPAAEYRPPLIPAEQLAAIVFTSGSTGAPLPYRKTWGRVVGCVRCAAGALGLPASAALIGTVPAQHMYGLESTVLLALLTGNAFTAARPFYPADVRAAIEAAPRPRVLITTPVHLRTVLADDLAPPAIELIVSATAPLSQELAREAERRFGAPLLEIYGSTETGQIAIRHTAECVPFTLLPGVRLRADNGQTYAYGGHVEQMTALCDVLEQSGEDTFILHGRTADLVNIAGKRSSFGYLNAQLNAIPGVQDGVFFLRESDHGGLTGIPRLAAVAVAPTLSSATLMRHLRRRIDPVFLPRPLVIVERLPRNATGKLPQQAAAGTRRPPAAPLCANRGSPALAPKPVLKGLRTFTVPADHPAFAGHFPGMPVLPGAALLDAVLHVLEEDLAFDPVEWQITTAKFLEPVRPGDVLVVEHSADADMIRFAVRVATPSVAQPPAAQPRTDRAAVAGTLARSHSPS